MCVCVCGNLFRMQMIPFPFATHKIIRQTFAPLKNSTCIWDFFLTLHKHQTMCCFTSFSTTITKTNERTTKKEWTNTKYLESREKQQLEKKDEKTSFQFMQNSNKNQTQAKAKI